jgi:cytosine/adenosine deaminase-related metal-dependent hydrolase
MVKKSKVLALSCFFGLFLAASAQAQQEKHYTVLIMERPAGSQSTVVAADGSQQSTYEYNDRGRGPKTASIVKIDREGWPVSIQITGVDYLKAPVAESFSFANGIARWKNQAESGEKKLTNPAFYLSMNGDETELLAKLLLKSPEQHVALLPEGDARIARRGDLSISDGKTPRHVVEYEISGLGFTPTPVWLDDDNTFFASVSSWTSLIRQGWESAVPALLKKQNEFEAARKLTLAQTLIRKPKSPLVFTNANLFEAETARLLPGMTVIVEGNRIKSVGKTGTLRVPDHAELIDATGKTLMPGLWDMHVHISPDDGLFHIAAGVTSVRDMANDTEALLELKRKIEANEEIGPRILMAGFMDGRGPYSGPTKVFVDTEEEAEKAIDNYARLGYSQIKIYSSIKPELVPKIIALAHAKGLRVSGHVPAFMTAEQFVRDGADEFQHINFFVLNFLFDEVKDTRTPVRFTAVADRATTIDLNSERVRSFVNLLRDRKIVVDPTVNVFEEMFTARPGTVSPGFAAIADRMPPTVRRGLFAGGLPVPDGKDEQYRESAKALLQMVKMLYSAGVPIVAGTDSWAGFALHRELELYVEAGIPPPEVLKIATLNAARIMKRDSELGSIARGKLADLILIDGDPTQHISDIRHTWLVVKDGNVYKPAELYQSIGIKP